MVNASDFGILSNTYKYRTIYKLLIMNDMYFLKGDFLSKMLRLFSKIVHGLEGMGQG